MSQFDIERIREDFPALKQKINGKDLVFLDSAASAQKPQCVIDAIAEANTNNYANIHRGVYSLSDKATNAYEATRQTVADFIHAKSSKEIVFTKGTTEAINFIATSLSNAYFKRGDEVILTVMEHHANIVPWQMMAREKGIVLKYVNFDDTGELLYEQYDELISDKTKLISLTHCSNVLGTVNDVKKVIDLARRHNIPVLLDGAQSIVHQKIDVQDLDCDFYAFSSHKLYGPTGVGVLYMSEKWAKILPPYQGGGDMIKTVTLDGYELADYPNRFEAGTPNIVGVSSLKYAIEYVERIGIDIIAEHEHKLVTYAHSALQELKGLKILGTSINKASVVTFVIDSAHANDVGTLLDVFGIAVRTGHHCAQPLLSHYGVPSTVRASFAMYNTIEEINALVRGLHKTIKMLG